tara:strand:- start:726 stop:1778 length:1053 start_codon:yes stop_codon:yes gene_type:complete
MPQLENTIGDAIRSIALEEDEAKRTQVVKILMQSKLKASFNDENETLLRTYLFKALRALKVNDWVVNKTTQSGISVSDASNIKDALLALMSKNHEPTMNLDTFIAACVSNICQFASTEEVTTTSTTFSFGAEEATDDLASQLGLNIATVTEPVGDYLLTDFDTQWKAEVLHTDLDAAVKTVMTPDKDGKIFGNFGSARQPFAKDAAQQLKFITEKKIANTDENPHNLHQFVLASIGLEALQLAPQRQLSDPQITIKIHDRNSGVGSYAIMAAVCCRIGGYLVNKVGTYNHRFAKYVSDEFRTVAIAKMGMDMDAIENPPNLQSKHGWTWPYTTYTPAKRGSLTVDDLLDL